MKLEPVFCQTLSTQHHFPQPGEAHLTQLPGGCLTSLHPPSRSEFSRLPRKGEIGVLEFFFICLSSNTTCPLCLGAGWGAAPELAPLWPQAAAPLSKEKHPNTWRALKIAILAFVLNYLQQGTKEGTEA